MNDRERFQLESVLRSGDYGAQNASLFSANSKAAQYLATLNTGISDLNALATAQSVHRRDAQEGSTIKDEARTTLSKALTEINHTARTMALETPGVADKFKLPHNLTDQNLLTIARAFIVEATPLEARFIGEGLDATFLADLQAAITAFEQAIAAHGQAIAAQTASTAAFKSKLKSVLNTRKQLDTLLSNLLKDDLEKLTAWKTASRVHKPRKSSPPSTSTPGTPPEK